MSDAMITGEDRGGAPSERTQLRRGAHHGTHDPSVIRAVIDAAPICHVAVNTAARLAPSRHKTGTRVTMEKSRSTSRQS